MIRQLSIDTPGQRLHEITAEVNADPTAKRVGSRREVVVHVGA